MERNSQTLNSALLVMDIQAATMAMLQDSKELKKNLTTAIAAARQAKMPIIYVVVGFRKGFPEISPANKSFSAIRQRPNMSVFEEPLSVDASVEPQPGDIIVTKRRVSAFTG